MSNIEAMKQALEFIPASGSMLGALAEEKRLNTITALRTAIAEAEKQEPVAWQGVHDKTDLYYRKPPQADVKPLYTHPPAAQRQPLTQEEIDKLRSGYQSGRIGSFVELIRNIEAAHGITGEKQ